VADGRLSIEVCMDIGVERQERVWAPLHLVWEEVDSLDQILSKTTQALGYEILPGGTQASMQVRLAWGPVTRNLDCQVALAEVRPPIRVCVTIEVPALDVVMMDVVELMALAHDESKVTHRVHVECRHRRAGWMRGLLCAAAEDHVTSVLGRVKARAEHRRQAEEGLLP
jgi:hypothetical protein